MYTNPCGIYISSNTLQLSTYSISTYLPLIPTPLPPSPSLLPTIENFLHTPYKPHPPLVLDSPMLVLHDFKIHYDPPHQWVVSELYKPDPNHRLAKGATPRWVPRWYFTSLLRALERVADRVVGKADSLTVDAIRYAMIDFSKVLEGITPHLEGKMTSGSSQGSEG